MTAHTPNILPRPPALGDEPFMPGPAPLALKTQTLTETFSDPKAPGWRGGALTRAYRTGVFGAALIAASMFTWLLVDHLTANGTFTVLELALTVIIALSVYVAATWSATSILGLAQKMGWARAETFTSKTGKAADSLRTAILMPIYNEDPNAVFAGVRAIMDDLAQTVKARGSAHDFDMFLLSDTRDDAIAAQERACVEQLRAAGLDLPLYYRRRSDNTDRKVGNLEEWMARWGGAYDAMLVLDADSLMDGDGILRITDALAANPALGLVQTPLRVYDAQTIWARSQQFANSFCTGMLGRGMALWSGATGNYWGHNAIMRVQAFADCAGLPKLTLFGRNPRLILSHDVFEVTLLRRAGWGTQILPMVKGSYEGTPTTFVDFIVRERRWCQGNMQHMRLITFTKGLHPLSIAHLLYGAGPYLLAPLWVLMVVLWSARGWMDLSPVEAGATAPMVGGLTLLAISLGMTLGPKFLGAAAVLLSRSERRAYGGGFRFASSFVLETMATVAYAPIIMTQYTIAVARSVLGVKATWKPQERENAGYSLRELLMFHWLETSIGAVLTWMILTGAASWWLAPPAFSLVLAIPLSALGSINLGRRSWSKGVMAAPHDLAPDAIMIAATAHRASIEASQQAVETIDIDVDRRRKVGLAAA